MHDSTRYERVEERFGYKFVTLKSGRRLSYWDAIREVETTDTNLVRAFSRAFKLAGTNSDSELADYELERLESRVTQLEEYASALRQEIDRRLGLRSKQERIALLRNVCGRSPEEAQAFLAKADKLEMELGSH